jgi:hypothetical protein
MRIVDTLREGLGWLVAFGLVLVVIWAAVAVISFIAICVRILLFGA